MIEPRHRERVLAQMCVEYGVDRGTLTPRQQADLLASAPAHTIAFALAARDFLDVLMGTAPARLMLRFVDWCPGLQRRAWARKYPT